MRVKQSLYRAHKFSVVQDLSQKDALGYYQDDDPDLTRMIQEHGMSPEPSSKLYQQNPCDFGFILTGVNVNGVLCCVVFCFVCVCVCMCMRACIFWTNM